MPRTLTNLIFWETGGFTDDHFFNFSSGQFYTGSESSPTFLTPSYTLRNGFGNKLDTITVVDPPSTPVPELSTWAMLLLGFVGLSYAGYRKGKTGGTLSA
jgi:hypothetical protein